MKYYKQYLITALCFIMTAALISCAEITPPTPKEVLEKPFGSGPLYRGMPQEEVVELWGQPNVVNEISRDPIAGLREEWIYYARYPGVPVDYNYLSKTRYLYFEDGVLISWQSED